MARIIRAMELTPTAITYRQQAKLLVIDFDDTQFELPCEYLRVYSPSAEVRGHGLAEPLLVPGKSDVSILSIDPVGNYAVRLTFSDGHNTGLYTWDLLHDLGSNQQTYWQTYLQRLADQGLSRDSKH